MTTSTQAFISGCALSAGLIIAIGAQNAFVLRQGIMRQHVVPIILVSVFGDIVLISLGALGLGALLASIPVLLLCLKFGGAVFVAWIGLKYILAAARPTTGLELAPAQEMSVRDAVLAGLALSFLNPHAILDTVVLLGSVAASFPRETRLAFTAGAIATSITWFALLGLAASVLAPIFRKAAVWRAINLGLAGLMIFIAWGIVAGK